MRTRKDASRSISKMRCPEISTGKVLKGRKDSTVANTRVPENEKDTSAELCLIWKVVDQTLFGRGFYEPLHIVDSLLICAFVSLVVFNCDNSATSDDM